jgi:hypothetical protein
MEDALESKDSDLFQFARNLAERETELDKNYLEQNVLLAWNAFEKIHSEFMASFMKYFEFLISDEFQYTTLLERIQLESIRAQNLRADFVKVLTQIPSFKSYTKTELFNSVMSFALSLEEYLGVWGIVAPSFEINGGSNDKRQVKFFLDKMLGEIQGQYQKVSSKYQNLEAYILS